MTSIDARLASLERTVKFQRFGLVAAFLTGVVVWSAGAMNKAPLESLKAKELLIEAEDGKTIAKLGGDGKGGAMLTLSMESSSGERSLQLAVNDKNSSFTAAYEGTTTQLSASPAESAALLSTKDGNKIQLDAGGKSTISLSHKDESWSRIQVSSDPKAWPFILLRENDGSIRWQSPKRGN